MVNGLDSPPSSPQSSGRIQWDMRITLGNVISIAVLVASMLIAFTRLESSAAATNQELTSLRETVQSEVSARERSDAQLSEMRDAMLAAGLIRPRMVIGPLPGQSASKGNP